LKKNWSDFFSFALKNSEKFNKNIFLSIFAAQNSQKKILGKIFRGITKFYDFFLILRYFQNNKRKK